MERAVMDLVAGLKQDHAVKVLCTKQGPGTEISRRDGIEVTAVGARLSVARRPLALGFPPALAGSSVDIVHYHLPFPLATLSHLLMPPVYRACLLTWHNDIERPRWFNRIFRPFRDRFLFACDAILASSARTVAACPLLKQYEQKCRVVTLGVDVRRFESADRHAVQSLRQKLGSPLILFAGRLVYYKGLDVLLGAMRHLDATLAIVGRGPLEGKLKRLSRQYGIADRVHFLGYVPEEELSTAYHACDVFVLPSTMAAEGFGVVQVEAMICGKPVVNTNLASAVPEVSVDGQTGLTVPPGDEAALVGAIDRLLKDPDLRERMGVAGRQRALDMYTIQRYVAQVKRVYEELADEAVSTGKLSR